MRRWLLGMAVLLWAGCSARVQHGLDERQANELQATLVGRGFDARKVPEAGKKPSWAIEVDRDQAVDATRVLAELGLPRAPVATSRELLGSTAWVPSAAEERSRQVLGLAGDLAQTLETIDGVVSARVHLAIPAPARPGTVGGAAKAAAFLKVRPGAARQLEATREGLRALIAGSVEGLASEQVTLLVSEVATSVAPPSGRPTPVARLRGLALVLAVLVSVLALAVALLGLRLRHARAASARAG